MTDIDPNVEKIKQQKMMEMMKTEEPSKFERGKVHVLDSTNFEEFTTEKGLVVIDFYADWCQPCKMMAPVLDELAQDLNPDAIFGKINVDNNSQIAMKYGATSIPTFGVFKDGEYQGRMVGAMPKERFAKVLDKIMKGETEE